MSLCEVKRLKEITTLIQRIIFENKVINLP